MDDSEPQATTSTIYYLLSLPATLRGGYWGEAKRSEILATPIDHNTSKPPPTVPMLSTKVSSNIAATYQHGQDKREELRQQYGMESNLAKRTLEFEFDGEVDNDEQKEDNLLDEDEQPRGTSNQMDAFRRHSGGHYYCAQRAFEDNSGSEDGTVQHIQQ